MHGPTTIQSPLTFDDLIDLHYQVEADELFLQLMAESPQTEDVR